MRTDSAFENKDLSIKYEEVLKNITLAFGEMTKLNDIRTKYPIFNAPPFSYFLIDENKYHFFCRERLDKIHFFFVKKEGISSFLKRIEEYKKETTLEEIDNYARLYSLLHNENIQFHRLDLRISDKTLFLHRNSLKIQRGSKKLTIDDYLSQLPKFNYPCKVYDKNFFGVNEHGIFCGIKKDKGAGKVILNTSPTLRYIYNVFKTLDSEELSNGIIKTISFFNPDYYLLKDIAKSPLAFGFIPFDIETLKKSGVFSIQLYCEFLFGRIPYKLNKLGFSLAFSFSWSIKYIRREDHNIFYLFCRSLSKKERENLEKEVRKYSITTYIQNPLTKRKKWIIHPIKLILAFYRYTLAEEWLDHDVIHLTEDTISLAFLLGEPLALKIKSHKSIKRIHDKLVRELEKKELDKIPNKKLKIKEKYTKLKVKGFDLIQKKRELFIEGLTQKHCVYGYAEKIESGECLIYTGEVDNKKWTIELQIKNNSFKVVQIRTRCNESPTSATRRKIIKNFNEAREALEC